MVKYQDLVHHGSVFAQKPDANDDEHNMKVAGKKKGGKRSCVITPDEFDAFLFDMDGVVTRTAVLHKAAWKETFDAFLKERAGKKAKFFTESDYLKYVDGKSREDGIRSFLQSRHLDLAEGKPDDEPGYKSVFAMGAYKNEKFLHKLRTEGAEVYETTIGLIRCLKKAGIKTAIVSSSRNLVSILKETNLSHVFDIKVDGVDARKQNLAGKPEPDIFLEAAKRLSVPASRAVVVEDALSGVEAGARGHFGLVIGVARNGKTKALKSHGADLVVRDLGEVSLSGCVGQGEMHKSPGTALSELQVCDENWHLTYDGYDPDREGMRESLCALGNGYLCTRAAAPESLADGVHYPGTYIAGVYNRIEPGPEGPPDEPEEVVNLPNWLSLNFCIDDGEWFDLSQVEILSYRQKLNMREGVVYRQVTFRDAQKRKTSIGQRWFVHMHDIHLAGLETTITAENWSGRLTVRSALDGTVINSGLSGDKRRNKKHLEALKGDIVDGLLFLQVRTNQSGVVVAMAARHNLWLDENEASFECKKLIEPGYVAQDMSLELKQEQTATFTKTVAVYTSRDGAISEPGEAACHAACQAKPFEQIVSAQIEKWRHIWNEFDLFIETNEDNSKIAPSLLLHLHSFHALQTASPNIEDLDSGIPARGWTGEAYQGHIFWDDLFIFPFINLRTPAITRALLKYRYRRLEKAREIAASLNSRGARFPWQSGSTGDEETPNYDWLAPKEAWVPDNSHLQIHVCAAIAYNIWQYYQVTNDLEFLQDFGAEMYLEIARFFASFARHNAKTDRYELKGVIGPDEYHTTYPGASEPGINNNAYTNIMAAWTLTHALEMLKIMPADHRTKICQSLALEKKELDLWQTMSRRIYIPLQENGIISQFEGYEQLKEFEWRKDGKIDMDKLKERLNKGGLVLNEYKLSKQADVLMLFYLFSADELKNLFERLGYDFSYEMIADNVGYYLPRTANTSTLSRVAHAWVLARLDRLRSWHLIESMSQRKQKKSKKDDVEAPQTWQIFLEALSSDYFDIQGGTTREGIHMGAMAGTLDIVQRCYAGIVTQGGVLRLSPQLPDTLTRLSFRLRYRGQSLEMEITHEALRIKAHHSSAQPIKIGFKEKIYQLKAGQTREFRLQKK